jgi:hypothetical protein
MMAAPGGGCSAVMDRNEPVSRLMRRMEALDLRLRPAELAELASARSRRALVLLGILLPILLPESSDRKMG